MRYLLFLLMLLLLEELHGQYAGGTGDGFAQLMPGLQNQSVNIYGGGNNDGFAATTFISQNNLPQIYAGGIDDGFATSSALLVNPLPSVYTGGNDDGFRNSLALLVNQLPSIYSGGIEDGTAIKSGGMQNALPGIYAGGNNDGSAFLESPDQNIILNIYTGSTNDGYASAMAAGENKSAKAATFISFSGTWQQQDVLLLWQVSVPDNIETFEIERSLNNGHSFEPLKKTKPYENENSRIMDYTYLDLRAFSLPATNLKYRIKFLDKSHNSRYSPVVTLVKNIEQPIMAVYPNPTNGTFVLQLKNVQAFENYKYKVYTSTGVLLEEGTIAGASTRFNLSHFASATYTLSILKETKLIQNFTIILQR